MPSFLTSQSAAKTAIPPGILPIDEGVQSKRAGKTLARAVSLHLEGKRESAAKMLGKAIEGGERDPALYSALGHIQYEMRDYAGRRGIYGQLVELEPLHRTAHFNLGVCQGNLKDWNAAAESFRHGRRSGRHAHRRAAGPGHSR